MIKELWWRFQMSLGTFLMLLLKRSSETGLFRHLSNHLFGVRNFRNTNPMKVIFFKRNSKFHVDFKNEVRNSEKVFCFLHNCMRVGIVKLSLLRTRYLSLAANVLTCNPKIWRVNKTDIFVLNWLGTNQWIWYRCYEADFNSPWTRLLCWLSNGPLKVDFLEISLTMLSETVVSEVQNIWASSFVSIYSKLNVDF